MKCDGLSDEQIARHTELTIATYGWMVQGVTAEDPNGGFAYTVGATQSFGIPELVIMDMDFDTAHPILNWTVELLRDGGSLDELEYDQIGWRAVHDDHLDSGIFGSYTRYYGHPPQPGWVVQIIPSHRYCCYRHANDATTDLSDPSIELYDA